MRVAKWLTGLLCPISLLLTGSWEVRFHPRQGKIAVGAARSARESGCEWVVQTCRRPQATQLGASPRTLLLGVVESLGTRSPDHAAGTRGAWSSVRLEDTGCWRLGRALGLARRWLRWAVGGRVCTEHVGAVGKQCMTTVPRYVCVHLSRPWERPQLGDLG